MLGFLLKEARRLEKMDHDHKFRMASKKKAQFDIMTKRDTFFEARQALGRNLGKTPIFGMPSAFDSSLEVGPSQHGTLK